jgi:hypothetical protein
MNNKNNTQDQQPNKPKGDAVLWFQSKKPLRFKEVKEQKQMHEEQSRTEEDRLELRTQSLVSHNSAFSLCKPNYKSNDHQKKKTNGKTSQNKALASTNTVARPIPIRLYSEEEERIEKVISWQGGKAVTILQTVIPPPNIIQVQQQQQQVPTKRTYKKRAPKRKIEHVPECHFYLPSNKKTRLDNEQQEEDAK